MSEKQQQSIEEFFEIISSFELLIREGEKMAKPGGNIFPIAHLPKKYLVDAIQKEILLK